MAKKQKQDKIVIDDNKWSVYSWAHGFHKPYSNDWGEAKARALSLKKTKGK